MSSFSPTQEQWDILDATKEHKQLKIDAKAGSGKSSTLVFVSEHNVVPSLYITFNKSMQEEAKSKFPSHVEVRTTHSLAYSVSGRSISHKLTRPSGAYKNVCGTGGEIARHFRIAPFIVNPENSLSGTAMGYAVKSTVGRFECSADKDFTEDHVSYFEAEKLFKVKGFNKKKYAERVLRHAKMLWRERINPDSDMMASHDTYLKMFQLSNPDLSEYEVIYLDEAQDSSPCLLDIIFKQKGRIVLVGDKNQSIYSWRGAKNAMESTDWPSAQLTKSFRFGQEVAEVAKDILLSEEGIRHVEMYGYEKLSTKVQGVNDLDKYTWIFRTNAVLISEAIELIKEGRKININVDVRDFKSLIGSAMALRSGNMKGVKHHEMISYNSWEEFEEEMEISKKPEMKRVYGYVKSGKAGKMLEVLDTYKPHPHPDIELSTAHRMKGLERDNVVLAEDFPLPEFNADGTWKGWVGQEQNLLYVAATRAKKVLVVNGAIQEVLSYLASEDVDKPKFSGIATDLAWVDDLSSLPISVNFVADGHNGLKLFKDHSDNSDHAIEAQNQMDELGDSGAFDESPSTNIDGSLRLMPELNKGGLNDNIYC